VTDQRVSRRSLLKWLGTSAAVVGLAACAPAAPSSGTTSNTESAAPDSAKKQMSIATYAIVFHEWQRHFAREWAAEHPDVELEVLEIVYADMPKLQLTMLATGTLWDVLFSGVKWYPYSALSGAFLALDDYISGTDYDIEDFFATAVESSRVDGTMYGLPYEMHPGNPALIIYNKTLLDEKGLDYPQDDWNVMQYAELAAQATDAENGIYGTQYFPGNYYDFSSICRAFGSELLGDEGREFLFNVAPESIEAAHWIWSLRNDLKVAPSRDESEGLLFSAGTLATSTIGLYAVLQQKDDIGDKFEYDFSLHPVGPRGQRGYNAFVSIFSASSSTEHPDEAFDLIKYLLRTESGIWVMQNPPSYPIPRKTVWESPEVTALPSIFQRSLDMMTDPSIPGPFAMPYNVRFQEFQDTWANTVPDLFYGDIDFETQMQFVQDECQAILDLPRPT
jgi:ABC-type glycerol-3-phosphate transport system substrate-binding protein